MSDQPSKYDDLVRQLCGGLHAEAVVLVVLGGEKGTGAAKAELPVASPQLQALRRQTLAVSLRLLADDIEQQITPPIAPGRRS